LDQGSGQGSGHNAATEAGAAAANANGDPGSIDAPRETKTTLADRIRALQLTASRVVSSN